MRSPGRPFAALLLALAATSRAAFCWGAGRPGNGSNSSHTPVRVNGDLSWAQRLRARRGRPGVVLGRQRSGQLGDRTGIGRLVPVAVAAPQGAPWPELGRSYAIGEAGCTVQGEEALGRPLRPEALDWVA